MRADPEAGQLSPSAVPSQFSRGNGQALGQPMPDHPVKEVSNPGFSSRLPGLVGWRHRQVWFDVLHVEPAP